MSRRLDSGRVGQIQGRRAREGCAEEAREMEGAQEGLSNLYMRQEVQQSWRPSEKR